MSETLFLTAAHCLYGETGTVWVTFDDVYDEEATRPSGLYEVVRWTLHEGFAAPGGGADAYDIAMVKLRSAPPVEPADLPALGLLETYNQKQLRQLRFTAVGYGIVRTSKSGARMASSTWQRGWWRSRRSCRSSRRGSP